ncbi:MAG: N-6 DNA methylase [Myxococcaceae bacterium]|nr:N-6 DNA methylase [Myxococcaceae bacterium]
MPHGKPRLDEEALVAEFPSLDRKAQGAFFTPAPLVEEVLELAVRHAPAHRPLAVIDPSCGAGAFLAAAAARLPRASLHGLELHPQAADWCRRRVRKAQVLCGDGLRESFDALTATLPPGAFELWVGNPPYNGTSSVLRDPQTYARLVALLPEALPAGTSLRDDFAFFLLRVARRLEQRDGLLAFVTPATLIDAFMYAPLRKALLGRLELKEVLELGGGVFRGARVRTCVTVWRSLPPATPKRPLQLVPAGDDAPGTLYRTRAASGPFERHQPGDAIAFAPAAPDYLLRPPPPKAEALDARWRKDGEPLTTLIPISSPGLKTRFDELLVSDDPDVLFERVDAFLRAAPTEIEPFAIAHGIPARHLAKLETLKALVGTSLRAERQHVRPFYRYAGARHRGRIPESARAYCYLDRRLIPRGDHRFRGDYDPHACDIKLVFNVRELPLSAALLDRPGCVHDHRHARFAPLYVPRAILEGGLSAAKPGLDPSDLVPNLSRRGMAWAERLGGPRALYEALVRFINSEPVQAHWAPAYGAIRELPVTFEALKEASSGQR